MKRFFTLLFSALFLLSSAVNTAAADQNDQAGGTIYVYNWGEYISDGSEGSLDINKEFTRRTGIKVVYTNYSNNEDLYAKLKSGGANYDIIIPSDYMIERMIKEDMLEKLNFDHIPNYRHIADEYKNMFFDPDNAYSVPYTVGMIGLIYNKKLVEGTPDSWTIMWDEAYRGQILTFNNPRDAFAVAQLVLGIDFNTENPEDWQAAYEKLLEQKPLIQSYVMDEIFGKMENSNAAIAPYYVGDYFSMLENNEDLGFVFPKEGTNFFIDSLCIPKGAKNKKGAELYINFLLESDIALANAEYICYASPNLQVINNEEYSFYRDELLYPPAEIRANAYYFHNMPPETLKVMSDYWDKLKISGYNYTGYYLGFGVAFFLILLYFIYRSNKRKKADID